MRKAPPLHDIAFALATVLTLAACGSGDEPDAGRDAVPDTPRPAAMADAGTSEATALASGPAELTPEEIETGRLDSTWRRYADAARAAAATAGPDRRTGSSASAPADSAPRTGSSASADSALGPRNPAPGEAGGSEAPAGGEARQGNTPESWDDITAAAVNGEPAGLPIHGDVAGPSVAKVQILLDQARFSPGVIDGRWGKNTEKAVYWFQDAHGLEATGRVDRATLESLRQGGRTRQVVEHRLTEREVAGPFRALPDSVYARARLECLCYESLSEKLAEAFHATPALLARLNPGVDLDSARAGTALQVPAVDPFHLDDLPDGRHGDGAGVARIRVSDGGHFVHALDARGRILFHFPSTLGSDYAPSPSGDFTVESVTFDPTWHYQPQLLTGVDPERKDAVLPAGPNNAVGIVWMALSKPHYGIHGTAAPESIGYATSHGCVRLTNWDAGFLARQVAPGTPVEFRDVTGQE